MTNLNFGAKLLLAIVLIVSSIKYANSDSSLTLEKKLKKFSSAYKLPGVSVSIVFADDSTASAAVGFADLQAEKAMTIHSRMLAASIGKTFVAASILLLVRDSSISLDDKLSCYLADRPWFNQLPNSKQITIRQLLQHTSGLADHVYLPEFRQRFADSLENPLLSKMETEDVIAMLHKTDPLFEPGEGWSYSDTGYLILGLVIEHVTQQNYYTWVNEKILAPLGLKNTVPANSRYIEQLAIGYTSANNEFGLPVRTSDAQGLLLWNPHIEWTGGGYASTSEDLARWGKLLFDSSFLKEHERVVLLKGVSLSDSNDSIRYGLGVAIYQDRLYGDIYGHRGWLPGYTSSLRYYKDFGVSIALQINTDEIDLSNGDDVLTRLESMLADFAFNKVKVHH